MTIKDLKTISASATTFIFYFCNSKEDAINGSVTNCIYSSVYDNTFDDYNIFTVYPAGKDMLEVYVDKKGLNSLMFLNILDVQIDIIEELLKGLNINFIRKEDLFIFTSENDYCMTIDLLDKTYINYEEHII